MPSAKMMNESYFNELMKKLQVAGELIRERQEEKQGALDDFAEEAKRFNGGKISEKAMDRSVDKTNKELERLDRDIKASIATCKNVSDKIRTMVVNQAPKAYKAKKKGLVLPSAKKSSKKKSSSSKKK